MIRILLLAFALAPAAAAFAGEADCWTKDSPKPWQGFNKVVRWEPSLSAAQEKAREEKKLILYYVLVGDLDKEGCWAAGDVLRTVTFSDEEVGKALSKDFVCAWKNRKDGFHNCDPKVEQGIYATTADAFPTMNIITLFLTPDLQVVHYFAGYFSPGLFLRQVAFAQKAREALFDTEFQAKDRASESYQKLHAEAGATIKSEAAALEAGGDAWKEATEGLRVPCYRGLCHTHSEECLGALQSVNSYLSIVHGDMSGKKDIEEDLQRFNNNRGQNQRRYGGWSSLKRVNRKVEPYAGEKRIVEGLKVLSEVEGSYLYGNPFTEE